MPWGLQRKCKFCVSRAISEYWQAGGIDGGESYCSRSGMECLYRKQSGVYRCKYQLLRPSGIECPYKNQSGCAGREPPAGSADIPGRQLIFLYRD